jgi:hypothetical protein
MKKIEEEWKTIEEFPNYEISNFGNCRIKKSKNVRMRTIMKRWRNKPCSSVYLLMKHENGKVVKNERSCGLLVARYFVENPNNYNRISYKDGDYNNHFYMNLEWVKLKIKRTYYTIKTFTKEEQIKSIEKHSDFIACLKVAVLNDAVTEFAYSEKVKNTCEEHLKMFFRMKKSHKQLYSDAFEECLSYIIDSLNDFLTRGFVVVNLKNFVENMYKKFFGEYRKILKTTEIDERRM